MAVAHTIDDALQLRSGLADVLIGEAEPIARERIRSSAFRSLRGIRTPRNLMSSVRLNSYRSRPPMIPHHIPNGKLR